MAAPVTTLRAPSDVLRLVVAACTWSMLLLAEWLFGSAIVRFASELLRGADAVDPGLVTGVFAVGRIAALGVLATLTVTAIRFGGARVLATIAIGIVVAAVAHGVSRAVIDADGALLVAMEDLPGMPDLAAFPTDRMLALGTAAIVAIVPWVPRRRRRVAWVAALVLATAHAMATPISAMPAAALVSGWLGGSAAVVLLGAPSMRPGVSAVIDGLRSVGLDVEALEPARVDARGSTPYLGRTSAGDAVFVKVLGRDERSADLLFRMYRRVKPASLGDERPFSSLRRSVEHEALVSLAVGQLGVRTPPLLAFADVGGSGWALAYAGVPGRSLDQVSTSELSDDVLDQAWQQVALLRRHRVAHRDLRLANLFLDLDGAVWLIDFGFAELAASPTLLATDLAELLTALSLRTSPQRVVAVARTGVGDEALQHARSRIRARYLSGATRTAVRQRPDLLREILVLIGGDEPTGRRRLSPGPAASPPNGSRSRDHRAH